VIERTLDRLHGGMVFRRRVRVLAAHLARLIPGGSTVLDIGAGDGSIGSAICAQRSGLRMRGIDVLVRGHTAYPVDAFDGLHIPHPDGSFDVALFVDVLHHTVDPAALLAEAARVARTVVIKDHLLEGPLASPTLRLMDWVGNARHSVVLPYNYLTRRQWDEAFSRSGLTIEEWQQRLGLYPFPVDLLFDRSLHYVARLRSR
jgi:ubiquinone/menaquinone biosynthesis C-methylase UbiE